MERKSEPIREARAGLRQRHGSRGETASNGNRSDAAREFARDPGSALLSPGENLGRLGRFFGRTGTRGGGGGGGHHLWRAALFCLPPHSEHRAQIRLDIAAFPAPLGPCQTGHPSS